MRSRDRGSGARGADRPDVVILGGGMAGLTLARHLLLETEKTVVLVERRVRLPPAKQKVGESLVQLAGYYLSKVLDLEEYLLRNHFMKYNLRFHWPSRFQDGSRDNTRFEDYSQSGIRSFSNVASFQLDRNEIERELLARSLESPRFTLLAGVKELEVELAEGGLRHRVVVGKGGGRGCRELSAAWVVDATGRSRYLSKRLGLGRPSEIRHGAFFWWVDGLVDVERLTDRSRREVRLKPERRHQGHLPLWLATNQLCGEGYWFWIIPLHGKTSLGLVFDHRVVDPSEVLSVEKACAWICRRHPFLARDLPHRQVLDSAGFRSFSYDCAQTLSPDRWAVTGEAGRFNDPLYSPGSDLIALHNTLIVAAVETERRVELESCCQLSEQLLRAFYAAYVPSYAVSYDALGDQETFSLKYVWELTVYFAGYVFPFINGLFTDRRFALAFLRLFSRLGPLNQAIQQLLSDYYQWKKAEGLAGAAAEDGPVFFDFTEIETLRRAEATFYEVGVSVDEAKGILAEQVGNLEELARFLVAHVASVVVDDPRLVRSRRFVAAVDLSDVRFDPEGFERRWAECRAAGLDGDEEWAWTIDPSVLDRFRSSAQVASTGASAG